MADNDQETPRRGRFRWLRRLGIVVVVLALVGAGGAVLGYRYFAKDLPDAKALLAYEPPLPSHIRAADGSILHVFQRERRVYRPIGEIPPMLINAFVSAEDKTFFEHEGLDYPGIAQAVWTNVQALGSGKRPVGASTITQQLAKNLIVGGEVTIGRKVREAILAKRIEEAFTKEQILELYLNQIFLGRNSYGVEAAAQAYFGQSIEELSVAEMAYLAILPKAPSVYDPLKAPERALERRNWVLGQMQANGYISAATRATAMAEPLATARPKPEVKSTLGAYFVEDVRRWLIAKFGETAADGPNSVYGGGLWVRTSFRPDIQAAADEALRNGLVKYDRNKGWHGAPATITLGDDWAAKLRAVRLGTGFPDWKAAVVLSKDDARARLGFEDGSEGTLPSWGGQIPDRKRGLPAFNTLKPGDVIAVKKAEAGTWVLRSIPEVSGGMVVQDPRNGHILAMVGGFDSRRSEFNRASQAMRQPGSSFKPFVYLTAFENGMTPSTIIADRSFCVYQSARLGRKCFRNFGGGAGAGAQTIRWGVEQSRNLMTVRTASRVGMEKVVENAKKLGIGSYEPVLAIALGAGDTTVLKLTNAFSILVRNGQAVEPVLVTMVQDRHGRVIYQADPRDCGDCNASEYTGEAMPRPKAQVKQVVSAQAAYQMTHVLEGVIERGTATVLNKLGRPIMGKTGTSTGPTNAWFVGGTPQMVAGVYLGYDRPRNLGGWVQGGNVAAPIWKELAQKVLTDDVPVLPFTAPEGIRMVRVDRRSGKRVFGAWPTSDPKAQVIWEAFTPESEPQAVTRIAGAGGGGGRGQQVIRSDAGFLAATGGIY